MSFTVNNFVSTLVGGANSGSATISVSSGHTVVVVVQERNFTGLATGTLTDSAGNTYSVGKSVTSNVYISTAFYSIGIASPITSVTYTTGTASTNAFLIYVWDVTATGTISFADAQAVIGASITGANGITTGSMTVTSADALLLAAMKDWSSGTITAGTGFTHDTSVEDFGEHRAVTASAAATFTDATGGNDYGAAGLALQVASAAPATTLAWQPIRPLSPPGSLPGKLGRFNLLRKGYLSTVQTSGSSALTFAQTGALTGAGALAGTSALVFGQTGAVTGAGALAGTSALVFNETGALTGAGALAGESDLVFGQTGTLTQPGLNGSASIVFGQTGALTASGVLAGTSALQFGQTAALTGAGALAGSSALVFNQTGALTAAGILAGTSALLFAQTAALTASGALAGSSALTFGASGTADLPAGALAGTSSLSFGGSATLTAFGALIGNCQIIFDAAASTGQVAQAGPVDSPRIAEGHYRRKKKLRKIEQPVSPVFIAPASLESIPQPVIDRVPNFTALSQTLGESPAALSARIDREIEFLMRAQAERDDEEAIVWIMRALEQLPPD